MIFIIEHLDPKVWRWSLLEYKHISKIVGKKNLWITNVKNGADQLKGIARVFSKSVTELGLKNACILESAGKQTLTPSDKKFDYFIFGGILGSHPEVAKSHVIMKKMPKAAKKNLGKRQMSTDTAVLVTKTVVKGTPISKIPFQHGIEMEISDKECIELPYTYVLRKGKPVLPPGLEEMLCKQKGF
jgi:ribosome biogenesis SPOUT family RNA methylase Rps3